MKIKLLGLIVLLLLAVYPLLSHNYPLMWIINLCFIYSILTLSWITTKKYSGYISFAHSIPFGLAAYLFVFIGSVSILVSAVLATAIFFAMSKLDREKFIFASFVVAVIFWIAAPYVTVTKGGMVYGGEEGFPLPSLIIEHSFLLTTFILALVLLFLSLLDKTRVGLSMLAIGNDEVAAMGLGINVPKLKLLCFFMSSLIASVAGLCYGLFFGHVSPEIYGIGVALFPFIATLFSFEPILATLASSILIFIMRGTTLTEYHLLIYATLLILSPKIRRINYVRG